MLFNSFQFLVFFPVVVLIYFLLPHKFRWFHLLAASCVFYTAFIPAYLLILFFTITTDYLAGIYIENATGKRRKLFLIASIVVNVAVLAVFKYFNFFTGNVNALLHALGITTTTLPYLHIILPVGLSFHTFQAMSYTIEVYRGNYPAEKHYGIYALYVMFFPQLVAGPIERPQNLLHQFKERHYFNSQHLLDGLRLMSWGLLKKVVIADRLAVYVNAVYSEPGYYHYLNLVIATLFFSIQIYCDFSGYSDMAVGMAKAMGFDLMINFRRPYFAASIREFWNRWHISLSTWFRDYLYTGLGGNRKGAVRTAFNIAVVFLISGFWHGANWTFIIWGALHAVFMLVYTWKQRVFNNPQSVASPWGYAASAVFTFILITIAWIFFRAANVHDAVNILTDIFTAKQNQPFSWLLGDVGDSPAYILSRIFIVVAMTGYMFFIEWKFDPWLGAFNKKKYADIAFMAVNLILAVCLGVFQQVSFIYFQF